MNDGQPRAIYRYGRSFGLLLALGLSGLSFADHRLAHASSLSFANPVIRGFAPDPSIARVGDDYYVVTSSFEYYPALPVYHSRDLVHWSIVSHAMTEWPLPGMDHVESSGGVQAATIRFHDGVFYIVATAIVAGKAMSFVVTTTNPYGAWSPPTVIADAEGIDPALFFDEDGKVWYVANRMVADPAYAGQTEIWLQQFDPQSFQLLGPRYALWRGCCQGEWAEGPRLFKRDGEYVLLIAEGGTSYEHAVSVAVAPSVTGPYRNDPRNPVLTHRQLSYDHPITSVGHADLVELPDGRWYAVVLGMRRLEGQHPLIGRETFLVPVEWQREREWWKKNPAIFPVFSPNTGKVEATYPLPFPSRTEVGEEAFHDDFDGNLLQPEWITRRVHPEPFVRLDERAHTLRLALQPTAVEESQLYSFVGIRQRHFHFKASVRIDFTPALGEEAGWLVIQKDTAAIGCLVQSTAAGQRLLRISRFTEDGRHDEAAIPVPSVPIDLQIRGQGLRYQFAYSTDRHHWHAAGPVLDGRALSPAVLPGFNYTGVVLGLYGSSNGRPTTGYADFSQFRYQPE